MARFRRTFSRRRTSSGRGKRNREWAGWETFTAGTANRRPWTLAPGVTTATSWILPPSEAISEYDEPTLVRLLIRHWAIVVPPDFATTIYEITYLVGIIVVRGEVGATPGDIDGIPSVALERSDQDYVWRDSIHFSRFTAGGAQPLLSPGGINQPQQNEILEIRSKRKIPQGHGLLYFNYVTSDSFGGNVVGYTSGRFLLLNH